VLREGEAGVALAVELLLGLGVAVEIHEGLGRALAKILDQGVYRAPVLVSVLDLEQSLEVGGVLVVVDGLLLAGYAVEEIVVLLMLVLQEGVLAHQMRLRHLQEIEVLQGLLLFGAGRFFHFLLD